MPSVTVDEAVHTLPDLLRRIETGGEDIVITRDDHPVARLVAAPSTHLMPRKPGLMKGQLAVDPAFFEPMTPDELKDWGY